MARIFVTGSADGLGQLAASALVQDGHTVVLHARNRQRGEDALRRIPGADGVITGDLADLTEVRSLADAANRRGQFDAVIHNAGVYQTTGRQIFAVNTLAPYVLTSLIEKPKRLIYLSSGMHRQGRVRFEQFSKGEVSYSDSKLHVLMLTFAVSRKWPDVYANAVDPGWVPTRMGGAGAPDDLQQGYETQVWLATGDDPGARVTGHYFHHKSPAPFNPLAADVTLQEKFLERCTEITGVGFHV